MTIISYCYLHLRNSPEFTAQRAVAESRKLWVLPEFTSICRVCFVNPSSKSHCLISVQSNKSRQRNLRYILTWNFLNFLSPFFHHYFFLILIFTQFLNHFQPVTRAADPTFVTWDIFFITKETDFFALFSLISLGLKCLAPTLGLEVIEAEL